MDVKKDLEKLLLQLKKQGINRSKIEKDLGYASNYVSQVLSKGGNEKVLKKIADYANSSHAVDYDMGVAIRKIEASNEVILSVVGELLARSNNQSSTVVSEQLAALVKKKLDSREF